MSYHGQVDGWQLAQPARLSAPSLMRLYAALHAAIRSVDDDTILLFEPGAGGAAYLEPTGFTEGELNLISAAATCNL